MERLAIIPIGKIELEIITYLSQHLEKEFGFEVEIEEFLKEPDYAYNPRRDQYLANAILERITKIRKDDYQRVLGVIDLDLYVPELNFVFGLADPLKKMAIISLTRLREEFYGLPKNEKLFRERVLKEVAHELGHTYGLGHCPNPKCVMHFSNSLLDTDRKSSSFCSLCQSSLYEVKFAHTAH